MRVNISIDDISPHPLSSLKVLDRCYELLEIFPEMKFSLFVPTAYWRTHKEQTTTKSPLHLSEYPQFCEDLRRLDPQVFEICFHGHWHGIPHKSDNDEFRDVDYETAFKKATLMREEVESVGLSKVFKNIFRPPAWRLSPPAFAALEDAGFELFALTNFRVESYRDAHLDYRCTFSDQFPPFAPLKIEKTCGIVYHACEWDRNFLSHSYMNELRDFLTKAQATNKVEFVFLEDF